MKKLTMLFLVVLLALSMSGCKSSDYNKAVEFYENGSLQQAYEMFIELNDYKDSKQFAERISEKIEELIKNTCEAQEDKLEKEMYELSKTVAEAYGASAKKTQQSDVRVDYDAMRFACITKISFYRWTVYQGYVGHIDGDKAVIDKTPFSISDLVTTEYKGDIEKDIEEIISDFWKNYGV